MKRFELRFRAAIWLFAASAIMAAWLSSYFPATQICAVHAQGGSRLWMIDSSAGRLCILTANEWPVSAVVEPEFWHWEMLNRQNFSPYSYVTFPRRFWLGRAGVPT